MSKSRIKDEQTSPSVAGRGLGRRQLLFIAGLVFSGSVVGAVGGSAAVKKLRTFLNSRENPLAHWDENRRLTVRGLSELIIPATDTPGATAAGVPEFIEVIAGHWFSARERQIFERGLDAVNRFCILHFGRPAGNCDGAQLGRALAEQMAEAEADDSSSVPFSSGAVLASAGEAHFFYKIRELTTIGYYTSEIGARQEHYYHPLPGSFIPDYPLAANNGRQWSW